MDEKPHKHISSILSSSTVFKSSNVLGKVFSPYNANPQRLSSFKNLKSIIKVRTSLKKKSYPIRNKNSFSLIEPRLIGDHMIESNMTINQQNANFFSDLLQINLERLPNDSNKDEYETKIFLKVLEGIADYLKPFSEILNRIKAGLEQYFKNCKGFGEHMVSLEEQNQRYIRIIENFNKEKALLLKKLNKSIDELEKYMKENSELQNKLEELHTKYTENSDKYLNHDAVFESMIKQSQTIHEQEKKIKQLAVNEVKLKNVIGRITCSSTKDFRNILSNEVEE